MKIINNQQWEKLKPKQQQDQKDALWEYIYDVVPAEVYEFILGKMVDEFISADNCHYPKIVNIAKLLKAELDVKEDITC